MSASYVVGLTYAHRLQMAAEARHQAIGRLFGCEPLALTSLMGPMSDGPEWPAGPAWLAARHGGHAIVMSDGLSDPWVERERSETGLGMEVFAESPDFNLGQDATLTSLADTWMFPMLAEISHTLAGYPRLCEKLCGGALVSLEFNIEHIKDGRGRVGALLAASHALDGELALPGGPVKLIAATLLTTGELKFLRGKGESGRLALFERLQQAGVGHLSRLTRDSVV